MSDRNWCCYVDEDGQRCDPDAEFEIIEDRTDIHPADNATHVCRDHVGALLGTIKEEGCPWRWIVATLGGKEE